MQWRCQRQSHRPKRTRVSGGVNLSNAWLTHSFRTTIPRALFLSLQQRIAKPVRSGWSFFSNQPIEAHSAYQTEILE